MVAFSFPMKNSAAADQVGSTVLYSSQVHRQTVTHLLPGCPDPTLSPAILGLWPHDPFQALLASDDEVSE